MRKIAEILHRDEDTAQYDKKLQERKKAIQAAYFNTFDSNFIMNVQGANAFAVDLGLGDGKTYSQMANYYRKLGYFDTGIFATDVLIRTLFENGDAELAVEILTNDEHRGTSTGEETVPPPSTNTGTATEAVRIATRCLARRLPTSLNTCWESNRPKAPAVIRNW